MADAFRTKKQAEHAPIGPGSPVTEGRETIQNSRAVYLIISSTGPDC